MIKRIFAVLFSLLLCLNLSGCMLLPDTVSLDDLPAAKRMSFSKTTPLFSRNMNYRCMRTKTTARWIISDGAVRRWRASDAN